MRRFLQGGMEPEPIEAVLAVIPSPELETARQVLESLLTCGDLVRLSPELCWHRDIWHQALEALQAQCTAHGAVTLAELRDALGTTRKYALLFLEACDRRRITIREGSDVTLIAAGIMVSEALAAAEQLAVEGISARVIDMFTIKPIDAELIKLAAAETGAIVTCENHSVINGLGSAVAEVLVQNTPVPMEMVGVQDEFGEVGDEAYLKERFGLTAANIVAKAKAVLARKK